MGKGGGGGGGTNWQDVELERMKAEERKQNQQREDDRALRSEEARQKSFAQSMGQAAQTLRGQGYIDLSRRGLDAREYGSIVDEAVSGLESRISPNDANPSQYFTRSVLDEAFGRARDDARIKFTNQVGDRFKPNFEQSYFGGNSDDTFINSVLGQQKEQALQFVNRARDRGQLDNAGFASAMNRINEMESTGRATANKLGDAVLQGNRTRLSDIANNARAGAGAYELGQSFDVGTYGRQFDDALAGMTTSLEGDVRGALEGQKFFDVGDIISRGGATQGAVNPASENIDQLAAREKLRTAARGGAGSTF